MEANDLLEILMYLSFIIVIISLIWLFFPVILSWAEMFDLPIPGVK